MRCPSAYPAIESGTSTSSRRESIQPTLPCESRTNHQSSRAGGSAGGAGAVAGSAAGPAVDPGLPGAAAGAATFFSLDLELALIAGLGAIACGVAALGTEARTSI